jgi:hypothetical protein
MESFKFCANLVTKLIGCFNSMINDLYCYTLSVNFQGNSENGKAPWEGVCIFYHFFFQIDID